jgi:hypothetical protein
MQQQQQRLMDMLGQAGGIESLARELGVGRHQAATGAAALIPAILGGFKKRAQSEPAGLEGLAGMLGGLGGGGLLDEVLSPRATNVDTGNDILAQIFGSKDVSRTVAQNASARTGIDPALLQADAADPRDAGRRLHGQGQSRRRDAAGWWTRRHTRRRTERRPGDTRWYGRARVDARPRRRRQSAGRHTRHGGEAVPLIHAPPSSRNRRTAPRYAGDPHRGRQCPASCRNVPVCVASHSRASASVSNT